MAITNIHYDIGYSAPATRANNLRAAADRGEISADEAIAEIEELRATALSDAEEALADRSGGLAGHLFRQASGCAATAAAIKFHADGGSEGELSPAWKMARKQLLHAMGNAVGNGMVRLNRLGEPVFVEGTPAAKANREGCSLSWDETVARRQIELADIQA